MLQPEQTWDSVFQCRTLLSSHIPLPRLVSTCFQYAQSQPVIGGPSQYYPSSFEFCGWQISHLILYWTLMIKSCPPSPPECSFSWDDPQPQLPLCPTTISGKKHQGFADESFVPHRLVQGFEINKHRTLYPHRQHSHRASSSHEEQ